MQKLWESAEGLAVKPPDGVKVRALGSCGEAGSEAIKPVLDGIELHGLSTRWVERGLSGHSKNSGE
jgi:hypothetical protein